MIRDRKYWIIVASKDHVQRGVAGGFAQACHGKSGPLKRMKPNDGVIYYSGKQTINGSEKCQEFTAIGTVNDEETYAFHMTPDFCPFRRNITFFPSKEVSILPLIEELQFIQNKKQWGYPFRYGFLEISKHDFDLISSLLVIREHATTN